MDRTGAQLLRDYMRDIVRRQTEAEEHGTWFREQVRAGLDSANAGNLLSYAGRQVALYIRDHGEEAAIYFMSISPRGVRIHVAAKTLSILV